MKKFLLMLCNIFSLGIFHLVIKKKAKQRSKNVNQKLIVSNKIPFKLDYLLDILGGTENIVSASSNISSVKIVLVDKNKCDANLLKKLSPSGVMFSSNSVTCLFGDFSTYLVEKLNDRLK